MIPGEVRRLAEDPMAEGAIWRSCEIVVDERFVLWFGPSYYPGLAVVQRLRFDASQTPGVVDEVRALLCERGLSRGIWQVGPSTPEGIGDALHACGCEPEPPLALLVLSHEPAGVVRDIEVRPVRTFDDFRTFLRVQRSAFDDPSEAGDLHVAFELERDDPDLVTYLAYIGGDAVACGRATFTSCGVALNGGGTVADARGRGAYRAVVGARWRDAVARGTPYLVTTARETSHPILLKMGFEQIGEVRQYDDRSN